MTSTETTADTQSAADAREGSTAEDESTSDGRTLGGGKTTGTDRAGHPVFETRPSLKPTGIKLGVLLVVGLVAEGVILSNPRLLGDPGLTEIAGYVVGILLVAVLGRYAVRLYLLKRLRYTITDESLRWEYSLLYRTRSRELPFEKLRGHEFSQGRIQSILGYGTIEFLTGGTNHSLGFLSFEHVVDPDHVREIVRARLNSQ